MARTKIERWSLTIRLQMDLHEKLVEMAKERGIALTSLICQLLNRGYCIEREMERLIMGRFES